MDENKDVKQTQNAAPEPPSPQGFKEKIWTPILSPVLALVAICLVTSLLLGLTNDLTAPMIEANTIQAANEARMELLPEADGFEELPVPESAADVTSFYAATNGAGYVIEAYGRGYGGQVPAMVAFGADGSILGVKFLSNSETPGLGKNLETDAEFAEQFEGRAATVIDYAEIDGIASSTITSKAALSAINAAVALYSGEVAGQSVDANAGATTTEKPAATQEGGE